MHSLLESAEGFFAGITLKHALTANGAVLAFSMTDAERALKISLLVLSIGLTLLTIYFKLKHNGKDKE